MDAYAQCPCGMGKKVKFCCPDLLDDFQKIQRMFDGEQYAAAQQHVDSLLRKEAFRDRPSLLGLRAILLRQRGAGEEAAENARHFLEAHPDNPIALAEQSLFTEDVHEAMRLLQRAMEATKDWCSNHLVEAWFNLAKRVIARGEHVSGIAMLTFLSGTTDEANPADAMLDLICRSPEIPLLIKRSATLPPPPEAADWKVGYEEATGLAYRGLWAKAAERLAALVAEHGDVPAIWLALGMVRAWLLDQSGAIEALGRYAALDVPLEDAVEAQAFTMLLSDDWFGDAIDEVELTFTVRDPQRLHEQLLSSDHLLRREVDPSLGEDGSPPPKFVGFLLDPPKLSSGVPSRLEEVPRLIGRVAFYGKQTDREARLEIHALTEENRERIPSILSELAGESIELPPQERILGPVSQTMRLSVPMFYMPAGADEPSHRRLREEYFEQAWLERWVRLPMKLFDGRSPSEVAALGEYRIRLLAAILVLETAIAEPIPSNFDFNRLRAALGLPTLEPIDPASVNPTTLPPVRWSRLKVEGLSNDLLRQMSVAAYSNCARGACRKFAGAILDRGEDIETDTRLMACSFLVALAGSPEEVLQFAGRGREIALRAGRSCARWDLSEVPALLHAERVDEMVERLRHIESRHLDEPGVAERFAEILVRLGILRPDGTVAPHPGRRAGESASPVESEPAAAGAATDTGKLWTPDSAKPSGGGGGLWTPE